MKTEREKQWLKEHYQKRRDDFWFYAFNELHPDEVSEIFEIVDPD